MVDLANAMGQVESFPTLWTSCYRWGKPLFEPIWVVWFSEKLKREKRWLSEDENTKSFEKSFSVFPGFLVKREMFSSLILSRLHSDKSCFNIDVHFSDWFHRNFCFLLIFWCISEHQDCLRVLMPVHQFFHFTEFLLRGSSFYRRWKAFCSFSRARVVGSAFVFSVTKQTQLSESLPRVDASFSIFCFSLTKLERSIHSREGKFPFVQR